MQQSPHGQTHVSVTYVCFISIILSCTTWTFVSRQFLLPKHVTASARLWSEFGSRNLVGRWSYSSQCVCCGICDHEHNLKCVDELLYFVCFPHKTQLVAKMSFVVLDCQRPSICRQVFLYSCYDFQDVTGRWMSLRFLVTHTLCRLTWSSCCGFNTATSQKSVTARSSLRHAMRGIHGVSVLRMRSMGSVIHITQRITALVWCPWGWSGDIVETRVCADTLLAFEAILYCVFLCAFDSCACMLMLTTTQVILHLMLYALPGAKCPSEFCAIVEFGIELIVPPIGWKSCIGIEGAFGIVSLCPICIEVSDRVWEQLWAMLSSRFGFTCSWKQCNLCMIWCLTSSACWQAMIEVYSGLRSSMLHMHIFQCNCLHRGSIRNKSFLCVGSCN